MPISPVSRALSLLFGAVLTYQTVRPIIACSLYLQRQPPVNITYLSSMIESGLMANISVGDIDIYYQIKGVGPPLVLIMGFTVNSDWWAPELVDALAARCKVILFDNRGSGRSGLGKRRYTIRLLARDTVGLLGALGIHSAHILGISIIVDIDLAENRCH